MFLHQIVHFGTSRSRPVSDVGQTANLVLTEAQSATAQNELRPLPVFAAGRSTNQRALLPCRAAACDRSVGGAALLKLCFEPGVHALLEDV